MEPPFTVEGQIRSIVRATVGNLDLRPIKPIEQQQLQLIFGHLTRFHLYRDATFQHQVRQIVPLETLSLKTSRKLFQIKLLMEKSSSSQTNQSESTCQLNSKDAFLVELLAWFKQDFFKWHKPSVCDCKSSENELFDMKFVGLTKPTVDESKWLANNVELYKCPGCRREERFARYNHPTKLLQTRIGRCGEWANCFAGICVALNYEVRIVVESGDHVWVEVRSESQKRWLHCDPCEQALDSPYMYEQGWKKQINYCFAIGDYEVVDTTWAYTLKPDQVLHQRSRFCREKWLTSLLSFLNVKLQKLCPASRLEALKERLVCELASYIWLPGQSKSRTLKETECKGRDSGSLEWRLARGEVSDLNLAEPPAKYTFHLNSKHVDDNGEALFTYNVISDCYKAGDETQFGWKTGVWSFEKLFRKTEHDWKMVYLARLDGLQSNQVGSIEWCFDCSKVSEWKEITIRFKAATYENANVSLQLSSAGEVSLPLKLNETNVIQRSQVPLTCTKLYLKARLEGGKGDLAWQHAQLFRESMKNQEANGFEICFKFDV